VPGSVPSSTRSSVGGKGIGIIQEFVHSHRYHPDSWYGLHTHSELHHADNRQNNPGHLRGPFQRNRSPIHQLTVAYRGLRPAGRP
jgi:hypothetical protein